MTTQHRSAHWQLRAAWTALLILCALMSSAWGEPVSNETSVTMQKEHLDGMPYLEHMAEFLAELPSFSYTVHGGYDVLQPDGRKIEFLENRKMAVQRPDHIRADMVHGDGTEMVFLCNGKELTLYNKADNVIATTESVGGIDAAIELATGKLGLRVPLALLLSSTLPDQLRSKVQSSDVVETGSLNGVKCVHVAARGKEVDLQVWIEEGDQPLPRRVVITYRNEKGMPQYWADLSDWKIRPEMSPKTFSLDVPKDVERMEFEPVRGGAAGPGGVARPSHEKGHDQ